MKSTSNKELGKKIIKYCNPIEVFRKLPDEKLKGYLDLLNIPEIKRLLEDEELINTAAMFFKNNLNISATSKAAFMHRNTLIYRLEKINREIGLNIKNFEEARILKNIMLVKEVIKEKNKE